MNKILIVTILITLIHQYSSLTSNSSLNSQLNLAFKNTPFTTLLTTTFRSPIRGSSLDRFENSTNSPPKNILPLSRSSIDLSSENSSSKSQASSDDTDNKIKWPNNLMNLNYSSLIKIDKLCKSTPDKCHRQRRSKEMDDLDCECEDSCKEMGNCCIDSSFLNRTFQTTDHEIIAKFNELDYSRNQFHCKEMTNSYSFRSLLVKSSCPNDFDNEIVRTKCEMDSNQSITQFRYNFTDPYQSIPVTSIESRITYSNIFCALCNEYKDNFVNSYVDLFKSNSSKLKFWNMNVSCDNVSIDNMEPSKNLSLRESFGKNFTYDSSSGSWLLDFTDSKGVLTKNGCSLKLHMPEDLQFFIKPCKQELIDKCASNWPTDNLNDKKIEALCHAYQSRVNYFDKKQEYRNVHCALCNYVDINQLGCPSNLHEFNTNEEIDGRSTQFQAFNTLFDVNYFIAQSNQVGKKSFNNLCTEQEIYDPFFQKCRNLICGFDQFFHMGECVLPSVIKPIETPSLDQIDSNNNKTDELDTSISNGENQSDSEPSIGITDNESSGTENQQELSKEHQQFTSDFRKCAKIKLTSGFMELKNDSIYLQQYELIVDKGNYNLTNNELLICVPFSPLFDKFESQYSTVATICLALSIISLILYLIFFCLVKELRNLSGRNLSSLCLSLIMVYCCIAIAPFDLIQNEMKFCKLIAYVKYYGLFASFCWTCIIAFDIYQTIRNSLSAFKYKTGPQNTRFMIYSSICWLLPMCAVGSVWLADTGRFDSTISEEFRPNFGQNKECWFMHRKSLLVFFVLPVGMITILNVIFFLLTSKNLLITTNRNKLKLSGQSKNKFDFNLYLRLFLLMGLTWVFGFLATYFDKIYLWYLFTLFNTLQGLFIFIAFACQRKILKSLAKLLLWDGFNLNKNSSLSTATRGTPTNHSTITHLNSSNKIVFNSDNSDEFKTKDLLFNRLNERSLSKSFGDLYTKNTANLSFYSSDSLNKSQLNDQLNGQNYNQSSFHNHQLNHDSFNHQINLTNNSINHHTNDQMINQQTNYDNYQIPNSIHRQIPNNSPSTFSSTIIPDNQTSSFNPYSQPNINNSQINNSQINRWFDW